MNNITSNSFKRYSYFPSSVPKTESKEAKKNRSSFYDDYLERSNQNKQETGISINRPVLKSPDLTPQKTQTVLQNPETTGSAIKKNIESVLSKKYGELDTRHIFYGDLYDASAYYGDNSHDHEYVKKGIELFYEDYPKAKT